MPTDSRTTTESWQRPWGDSVIDIVDVCEEALEVLQILEAAYPLGKLTDRHAQIVARLQKIIALYREQQR